MRNTSTSSGSASRDGGRARPRPLFGLRPRELEFPAEEERRGRGPHHRRLGAVARGLRADSRGRHVAPGLPVPSRAPRPDARQRHDPHRLLPVARPRLSQRRRPLGRLSARARHRAAHHHRGRGLHPRRAPRPGGDRRGAAHRRIRDRPHRKSISTLSPALSQGRGRKCGAIRAPHRLHDRDLHDLGQGECRDLADSAAALRLGVQPLSRLRAGAEHSPPHSRRHRDRVARAAQDGDRDRPPLAAFLHPGVNRDGVHAGKPGGSRARGLDPLRRAHGRAPAARGRRGAPRRRRDRHGAGNRGTHAGVEFEREQAAPRMTSFTSAPAWRSLLAHRDALAATRLADLWSSDPERGAAFTFGCAGLAFDFSRHRVTAETLALLVALARERDLSAAVEHLFTGERVNATENRPALHMALRGDEHVSADGHDLLPEIQRNRERMPVVAEAVRDGHSEGAARERLTHVLALGIGGSSLGPRLAVEALRGEADWPEVRFVAHIDAAEFDDPVPGLDPARTLAIVASETFTTQETMENALAARQWITAALGPEALAPHLIASASNSPAALPFRLPQSNVLPFGEWVGGRYSLWSSVGLPVAIAVGMTRFGELLAGAHAADLEFRSTPLERNVPALLGLIGVWNRDALGIPRP